MARTKPPDQRREDLLDAAEAAFLAHGVAGTTVEDITTGAGVAKGTFYLHFRSRADVVRAVQVRYGERFVRRLEAAIAGAGDDWGAKLDGVVDAGFEDHRTSGALHDVIFVQPGAATEGLEHEVDDLVGVLRDLLDAGVAAGAFDVADTRATAMVLFNAVHGIYNPVWAGIGPVDEPALAAAARTVLRRAAGLRTP
ncbi:MAG: TetR/AcrR family transcriptional regulator [Acidimicrobiia bacterium]